MTTVLLIRHAENDYIKKGKMAGRLPGVRLNERGRAQTAALAEVLKARKLAAVYSSPLDRAIETAKPIAEAQGLEAELRWGLEETDVGKWQGQSFKRLARGKLWRQMLKEPARFRYPEGESMFEQQVRLVEEVDELLARHKAKDTFACVGHADPFKLLIAHHIGLPLDAFQRLFLAPASVSELAFEDGGVRLVGLNGLHPGV